MQAGRGRLELIGEPAYLNRYKTGCRERKAIAVRPKYWVGDKTERLRVHIGKY
jgi:hypothetical protein